MSEHRRGKAPCPKMREAALPGGPVRNLDIISTDEITETSPNRQALWLSARFGLTVEIAATIASLAFSVAR